MNKKTIIIILGAIAILIIITIILLSGRSISSDLPSEKTLNSLTPPQQSFASSSLQTKAQVMAIKSLSATSSVKTATSSAVKSSVLDSLSPK